MPIEWRAAADTFEQVLRTRGLDPSAVSDVEAAWRSFVEFMQIEHAGTDPAEDDGDGYIVQWGRWSWIGDRLSLNLTRQLTPAGSDELWQVNLAMVFTDEPGLIAAERESGDGGTGFRFDPIGPQRAAGLAATRDQAHRQALVRAMWAATPVRSELTFESMC